MSREEAALPFGGAPRRNTSEGWLRHQEDDGRRQPEVIYPLRQLPAPLPSTGSSGCTSFSDISYYLERGYFPDDS